MDPWGDHAVCCATGPSRIARHDHVNATWMATLGSTGYHVKAEVRTSTDTRKRSADTLVYNWDKGSMATHDWTISHVLRPQGLKARNPDPDWALKEAETRKIRSENDECLARGIEFAPLAMDTLDSWPLGPSVVSPITAGYGTTRTKPARTKNGWPRSSALPI